MRALASVLVLQLITVAAYPQCWMRMDATSAGIDPSRIAALQRSLEKRGTDSFLVVRRGRIVHEWYAANSGLTKPHGSASLAKALVGGLSLLIALEEGRLEVDHRASKFIPEWKSDPQKSKITIRHLATHSSGIEDAEEGGKKHELLTGWKGAFWRRDPDPFWISLRDAPVMFEPGSRYAYSNPGMAALSYAVTSSLQGTPHPDLKAAIRDRIARPLGIGDSEWDIGYGRTYELNRLSLYANWGGGLFTARAAARFGLFMLQRGEWEGRQLVLREWVDRMTTDSGTPVGDRRGDNPQPRSGLCWWLNTDGVWEGVPRDAIAGAGAGHQLLLVVPSLDLVMARFGQALEPESPGSSFWAPVVKHVFRPVVEAMAESTPYPHSPIVRGVRFAPQETILREAIGSDNWPLTWGDDDATYTSYGDGWGFTPYVEQKLSMGFSKVLGGPEKLRGLNIRSESGERSGDGAKGAKASGMLMVGGTLYLWVRNVGNAQLVWSEDHARTWHWGFRLEESFGSPSFLNFGKNYSGARDRFVYAYSQDGPSAYDSDNGVVLMRAPVEGLRRREAWEFFAGILADGKPKWARSLRERYPVFRFPRHCQRVDAIYHPGLKRYLLVVGYNHSSGWGIFDAPEPWGDWTTVFHTDQWDIESAHGYRLPTKWIHDPRTLYLVFSAAHGERDAGYDAFCVRRLELELP